MIKIRVKFFNILAAYTSKKSLDFSFPENTTLSNAIIGIARHFSPAFQEIVIHEGTPSRHLRVFLNGKPVGDRELNTILEDGDEIMLFPAVAGG